MTPFKEQKPSSLVESVESALSGSWALLEYMKGGGEIVRDQYRDNIEDAGRSENRVRHDYTGRYPLELLQNAHDACADADHNGAVRFVVTETALIVANEGEPFTPERIRSLVRLGSSEKVRRHKRHTIGYKGIGFTAVFEISDRPQIISKSVGFEFDRQRARRKIQDTLGLEVADVPARGFPFVMDEHSWAPDTQIVQSLLDRGAITVVRLPLRVGCTPAHVAKRIEDTISAEVLLFMPYVNEIELSLPNGQHTWAISSGRRIGDGRLMHLRSSTGVARSWLVTKANLRIPKQTILALDDPLWSDVSEFGAAVALPWRDRPYSAIGTQKLHVYFPTNDDFGRALLINGDFYVDSGRRHIETEGAGGDVSRSIATAAAKLAARLAASIADRSGRRLLECLAQTGATSGFGSVMGDLLEKELRRSRIVRPADGSSPRRAADMTRLGLGSRRREQNLLKILRPTKDIVRPGDDEGGAGELLERLGTAELSFEEIAQRVQLAESTLSYSESLGLLVRWLESLSDSDASTVRGELQSRQIVQDSAGRWRKLREVAVHQPNVPKLPSRLRKTELAIPVGLTANRVTRVMSVSALDLSTALDIVIDAIRSGRFGGHRGEAAQGHYFMREAWKRAPNEVARRGRRLGALPVPTRKSRGRRITWLRADQAYFTEQWTKSPLLEKLYGAMGIALFLAVTPPRESSKRKSDLAFYKVLGVASEPRTIRYADSAHRLHWLNKLKGFPRWRSVAQMAFKCDEGHPQTARHVTFSALDRLDDILASNSRSVYAALAAYLSSTSNPFGGEAEVYCMGTSHAHVRRNSSIGYQRWILETTPWIPVRNDPLGGDSRRPGEAWTGARMPRWLQVPQARLRLEMTRGLNLVNSERPGFLAIEHSLGDLSKAFTELADAPDEVVQSALWLLNRLERAHNRPLRQVHSATDVPPLPCFTAGRLKWSRYPLIADLRGLDALPAEVLPEGAWPGLKRAYDLRLASETIEHNFRIGPRTKAPRLLPREAKARLTAVLVKNGANETRVATRLARLREESVSSLQVVLCVNGKQVSEPDSPTYFLEVRRTQSRRTQGATLYLVHPVDDATRIQIGRDLADYLGASSMYSFISLFLTTPEALVESEHLAPDDIAEARRQIERRRRKSDDSDSVEFELFDLHDYTTGEQASGGAGSDHGRNNKDQERPRTTTDNKIAPPLTTSLLPPLVHDAVSAIDVVCHSPVESPHSTHSLPVPGKVERSGQAPDWEQIERAKRLYGQRGEEAAYESERRRLNDLGLDPDLVKWISRHDELSAYDIESLDDDGGPRYIEVKATTGSDPAEAFPISVNELQFAIAKRSRYFIYRVVDVKSKSPPIYRYRDPIAELASRRGLLRMKSALLGLPGPDSDVEKS